MNPIFATHIETVPKLFSVLREATPFVEKGLVAQRKRAGIYAFFENNVPQYVGRTKNLKQRLRSHILVNHYSAAFAFKMARGNLGLPATYNAVGARGQLQNDAIFRPEFLRQMERVKAMQVRFVEIALSSSMRTWNTGCPSTSSTRIERAPARMALSLLQRNQLDYALRIGGYHNLCEAEGEWVVADATFAPGRCFLAYSSAGASQVIVATSLPCVAGSFAEEGHVPHSDVALPTGAVNAFLIDIADLHAAVRRLFELSRSLPSAPLDRFHERTLLLPTTTEVERLVVLRIGQDIFREALMDFWSRRCAVTGLDQPELLRASHMKPWADCASDAERLDPFNGLLLAVHWDAAFDCGLVTFADDGALHLSGRLSEEARSLLLRAPSSPPRISGLRARHMPFLQHHRARIWSP
jgi:putative restriction endonuclease